MSAETPINVNDKEKSIIQATFKDNEPLLKSIRALFFGLPITDEERALIKTTFVSADLRAIMWKRFCPTLDRDTPIGQVQDIWLGAESMVFGQSRDTIYQAVNYKQLAIEYTTTALNLLVDPNGPQIDLTYKPSGIDPLEVALLARSQFIRHVEQQLLFLKLIGDQKVEKPTEKTERTKKDSSK